MILKSSVNYTGRTSLEIGVRIESECPISGEVNHTASAYLTFVSLGDNKKPTRISEVIPETEEEKRRFDEGKARSKHRKKRLKR